MNQKGHTHLKLLRRVPTVREVRVSIGPHSSLVARGGMGGGPNDRI